MLIGRGLVPTLAEAEKAAKVVAGAGAGCVVLFGSVARGEAHHCSDIDLMVIYDNLDYGARQHLASHLTRLAGAEAGCPVDIHLTDRPEWKMRTEQVLTSFESNVKSEGLVMVDNQPGEVDWDKEMVMPGSDYEEAVERLRHVGNALEGIQVSFLPTFYQRQMQEEGREMMAFSAFEQRLAQGCAAGHLTIETALKCLIHLASPPKSRPWGHKIERLLQQLNEPHRSEIGTRLARVGVQNLESWQQKAPYERFVTATPALFEAITTAACRIALYTADQFEAGPQILTQIRTKAAIIEREIARRDLYTGQDRMR